MSELTAQNKIKIMVYGVETIGYKYEDDIETKEFSITFHPIDTDEEFNNFDLVIFFDKTFERRSDGKIFCTDEKELLKRIKQLFSLLNKGGSVCALVYRVQDEYWTEPYFGGPQKHYSDDTSLLKVFLNDIGIGPSERHLSDVPLKHFKVFRSEYVDFIEKYGVTETYFANLYKVSEHIKPIAKSESMSKNVGLLYQEKVFLIPCLVADKDVKNTEKLFTSLGKALTESLRKLSTEIPAWIDDQVLFPQEKEIRQTIDEHKKALSGLEEEKNKYHKLKSILCLSGDALVDRVSFAFSTFMGFDVESIEDFKDDLKLFLPDEEDKPVLIAIGEVKGVNSGVKREFINQTDSHRERIGLSTDLPALLIINTRMDAVDLERKDLEVASEIIQKAVSNNILIIRTLDLINLIQLNENGEISLEDVHDIIKTKRGWLKADADGYDVIES